jgi:FkbM family methyltransferase
MRVLNVAARRAARAAGFTVLRAGSENRFDASDAVLRQMAARGVAPRIVIDCGANRGQWTRMASRIFPAARFHLIEPQHGCHEALEALPASRFTLHRVAVTAPGVETVRMIGGGDSADSTGAFVAPGGFSSPAHAAYPATTLDALLTPTVTRADRALLKLDSEGHELEALEGATAMLSRWNVCSPRCASSTFTRAASPSSPTSWRSCADGISSSTGLRRSQDASRTAGPASGTSSSSAATARSQPMSGSSPQKPWCLAQIPERDGPRRGG